MKSIVAIIDKISMCMRWPAFILIVSMVIVISIEIFARYVFRSPLNWGLEFSETSQAFLTAFAASWVLLEEKHISVRILVDRLSSRMSNLILCIGSIIGTIFCAVFSWTAWIMVCRAYKMGESTETLNIPLSPITFLFFLGFCLFTLSFISRSYKYYCRAKKK